MPDDLENLGKELQAASRAHHKHDLTPEEARNAENMNTGLRAGSELIGAILGGGLLGWGLDKWFETSPLFLIIMLLFGIVAGFLGVWRITQKSGSSVGYSRLHSQEKAARTVPGKKNEK